MHIPLPDGDVLIPDAEFGALLSNPPLTARTLWTYEQRGLPVVKIGGRKYRPQRASLEWVAAQIKRRNPLRRSA
jgi:hypothetical protein